jgi:hypothetical protein
VGCRYNVSDDEDNWAFDSDEDSDMEDAAGEADAWASCRPLIAVLAGSMAVVGSCKAELCPVGSPAGSPCRQLHLQPLFTHVSLPGTS